MKMVRVEALYIENTEPKHDSKICILGGIDDELRLKKGPWYGHMFDEKVTSPFQLRDHGEIFWGYEDHASSTSNIDKKPMRVGELFTLNEISEDKKTVDYVYRIIAVNQIM